MAASVQLGFAQVSQDDKDIVNRPTEGGCRTPLVFSFFALVKPIGRAYTQWQLL